jgi:hypothetical protein
MGTGADQEAQELSRFALPPGSVLGGFSDILSLWHLNTQHGPTGGPLKCPWLQM